ncbi:VOC family protein [Sandaracinobacteroides saxicola]|uniref:VOC family protein n=1 Tax=Sandaracinobacteroides saxicola TaxID=2759707 RepID=A0A7G5II32_9SPHN|nr:VOC family protein [Sandaracinobacteroides saxicola]QMW23024.1 VOC family protein [Sandaracinobacteroides saxicola]
MADTAETTPTGGLTPHIQIGDNRAAEAIDFYRAAFGATERHRQLAEDGRRLMHAHVVINGASLMLHDEFPEYVGPADVGPAGGSGLTLHLQVDDTDVWFGRAVAAGARAAMPPADMFWGDRYAQVVDPFGYRWSIGGPMQGEAR